MPRKPASTPTLAGTATIDVPAPLPVDLRPGAAISPETVNVFEEGVSAGTGALRLAPLKGRPAGDAIAVSVRAWVRNLAYDKDLWIDLALTEEREMLHAETLALTYQEPAGAGGDFFTVGAAIPAPKAGTSPQPRTVLYRLYGQMNGQIFTDGVLHHHEIVAPPKAKAVPAPEAAPKPARKTAATTVAPAVPKPAAPAVKAATKTTTKSAAKTPAPATPTTAAKPAAKAASKAATSPAEKAPAATRKRTTPKV